LTLQVSPDDGRSWHIGRRFENAPAAYSDLVQLNSAAVGVLYETGSAGPYEKICFRRVELRELS
jgi:sialidase-1